MDGQAGFKFLQAEQKLEKRKHFLCLPDLKEMY